MQGELGAVKNLIYFKLMHNIMADCHNWGLKFMLGAIATLQDFSNHVCAIYNPIICITLLLLCIFIIFYSGAFKKHNML